MLVDPTDAAFVSERLAPDARADLERARESPWSYGVRLLASPGPDPQLLVVLGEAHLKLAAASALGKRLMAHFELRGVETFQSRQIAAGRVLRALIHLPRVALQALTLGAVKGSTITDAKALAFGRTIELERTDAVPAALHAASLYFTAFFAVAWAHVMLVLALALLPRGSGGLDAMAAWVAYAMLVLQAHMLLLLPAWWLREKRWSWIVHPALGLVTTRDALMAAGAAEMLRAHTQVRSAVVVMGRAHVPGFEQRMVREHGFRRVAF